MDSARHSREAGRPPRSLVLLASAALVAGTGAALWALPAAPPGGWDATRGVEPGVKPGVEPGATPTGERTPAPSTPETLVAARQTVAAPTPPAAAPLAGEPVTRYRGFLDAAGEPRPELLRAGVRSFAIGHVVAGPGGCSPRWAGAVPRGGEPVAARIGRLRADGGEVWPAFGGPYGQELSVTCENPARLLAAYRHVVTALDPPGVDIEPTEPAAPATETGPAAATGTAWETVARRRAAVLARLQREARTREGPTGGAGSLRVTFTLPASRDGLRFADREALRITREAGVEIESVGLLVPMGSGPTALHGLAVAARAARPQIAAALGVTPDATWRRMGLAPVLAGSRDLGPGEAARLAAFRARNGLAWLSVRGARPSEQVLRILAGPSSAAPPVTRSHPTPDGYPTP
ncbi:hypothetical protein [Microbispora siamensis]|uniref:hypothetical protein n=1 Tax=Microbispora siamensis TaxID=564413 RepID=UPI0019502AB6|nr:hypothetical protein [Microbispora siamensis]